MLAYTGTFGGGFSATLSLEDPQESGPSGSGVDTYIAANSAYQGLRSPDVVLSLDLAQGWGGAHLAGVAHDVNMIDTANAAAAGWGGLKAPNNTLNTWGWAIDGGVKFNLPMLGAGDLVEVQGQWSRNAVWYSGIPDAMWGENGQVNGNGMAMPVADAWSNMDGTWATPTAWGISALAEFHLGPTFAIDPEIAYAHLSWSNDNMLGTGLGVLSDNSSSWMGGAVFHWDPVVNLDFNLELLYQSTHQAAPSTWAFVGPICTGAGIATCTVGHNWPANSSGLEGRFEITRSF
jgi:hypothetical protein